MLTKMFFKKNPNLFGYVVLFEQKVNDGEHMPVPDNRLKQKVQFSEILGLLGES